MLNCILFFVPRFITEWVVLEYNAQLGGYVTSFPASLLMDGEHPYYVMKIKSFTFLGIALFPRAISDAISYSDYLKLKNGGNDA